MIRFDGPGRWMARVDFPDFGRRLDFGVLRASEQGPFPDMVLEPVAFTANDPASVYDARALTMPAGEGRAMLQAIVDSAWAAGIKPKGYADEARETGALRAHLEDMRALAFAKSGTTKP